MDLQIETRRTRDEFAADLAELSAVDWGQVWPGYSQSNPLTWCAERGWQLVRLNRVEDITVRLRSGGLLYLSQARQTKDPVPVTYAVQTCWRAGVQSPDDNGALFTTAEAVWSDYVTGASGTVGRPDVVTAFDDPAFPDLPDWSPERRASRQTPYRLALWSFTGALALLHVSPSANATTVDRLGDIQISLLLRPNDVASQSGGA